jgi:hypothetical protein
MEVPKKSHPPESPNTENTTSPDQVDKPFVPPWIIPPELWDIEEVKIDEAIQDEDEAFKDGE